MSNSRDPNALQKKMEAHQKAMEEKARKEAEEKERLAKEAEEKEAEEAKKAEAEKIASLEEQIKIAKLEKELAELKGESLKESKEEDSEEATNNAEMNGEKKKPKHYSLKTIIYPLVFLFILYSIYGNPFSSTPRYVQSATSDMRAGLTSQFGVSMKCSNTEYSGRWFIGCRMGGNKSTIYLFEAKNNHDNNPSHLSYKVYAVNGKAMSVISQDKMGVYEIKRSDNKVNIPEVIKRL